MVLGSNESHQAYVQVNAHPCGFVGLSYPVSRVHEWGIVRLCDELSWSNIIFYFMILFQDLKEAIMKGLGFQAEDFRISGFDSRDMLVGHSVAYEFDVEINNKVLPMKLLEDVKKWEYVDMPIFQMEEPVRPGEEQGLIARKKMKENMGPVLAPFQLAGPMELWIQDANDMKISLPVSVSC